MLPYMPVTFVNIALRFSTSAHPFWGSNDLVFNLHIVCVCVCVCVPCSFAKTCRLLGPILSCCCVDYLAQGCQERVVFVLVVFRADTDVASHPGPSREVVTQPRASCGMISIWTVMFRSRPTVYKWTICWKCAGRQKGHPTESTGAGRLRLMDHVRCRYARRLCWRCSGQHSRTIGSPDSVRARTSLLIVRAQSEGTLAPR